MNLKELREDAWRVAREEGRNDAERMWTVAEMNDFVNRTLRRICRETECLYDATTPEICLIPVQVVDWTNYQPDTLDYMWANDPEDWLYQQNVAPYLFAYDPRILRIDEVKWAKWPWRLIKVSCRKWQRNAYWEKTRGIATEYCTDLKSGHLALNFRMTSNDILRLSVRRLPLADLKYDTDVPEIRGHYHDFLRHGILEQMYQKHDSQTFDPAKSVEHGMLFRADIDRIKVEEERLNERLNVNNSMVAFR